MTFESGVREWSERGYFSYTDLDTLSDSYNDELIVIGMLVSFFFVKQKMKVLKKEGRKTK